MSYSPVLQTNPAASFTRGLVSFQTHRAFRKCSSQVSLDRLVKMTLQWTLVAAFLYSEIAAVTLLLLPIISAQRWNRIFKSRAIGMIRDYVNLYFSLLITGLAILMIDAIRSMRKYDNNPHGKPKEHYHLEQEMRGYIALLRAQRNFYIVGFRNGKGSDE